MIKKIKRLPFYIPMIPVLVVGCVFLPIRWISDAIIDFCDNLLYEYGLMLRRRFPELVIKVHGSARSTKVIK